MDGCVAGFFFGGGGGWVFVVIVLWWCFLFVYFIEDTPECYRSVGPEASLWQASKCSWVFGAHLWHTLVS